VQETPQEHFLNTKARFQKHYDEEDAAELLFACNNLINHGIDLDWDNTLQKMEDILKEKAKVVAEEALATEEEKKRRRRLIREGPEQRRKDLVSLDPLRSRMNPETGVSEKEKYGQTKVSRKKSGTAPAEGLSEIRDYKTAPMAFDIPETEYEAMDREGTPGRRQGDPVSYLGYLSGKGGRYRHISMADDGGLEHIQTLVSDRPKGNYFDTKDEHDWLSLFHENTLNPNLYRYLLAYYHPKSATFVEKMDREMDEHDAKIFMEAMGIDDETLKNNPNAMLEEMRRKTPEQREKLYQELGHLAPNALGPVAEMMRHRIYMRAFSQWDKWYSQAYPDSPLLGESQEEVEKRQILFLEHKALKLDGCNLPFIQKSLYKDKGVRKQRYLDIISKDAYNDRENRNPANAMGTRPLEFGLEMLDSDPTVDDLHEMKTCIALFGMQVSHDLDRAHNKEDTENIPADWEEAWNLTENEDDDHWDRNSRTVSGSTDDFGDISFFFRDGDPFGIGWTEKEWLNHMMRSQHIMTLAYHYGWTSPHNISNNHVQSQVLAKNPNIWEESMQRALNEAHRFFARNMLDVDEHGNIVPNEEGKDVRAGNERSRAAGRQLAEIRPIFAKVRDFYDAREEFDTEDGLPRGEGHSYVNYKDTKATLEKWLRDGAIDAQDMLQMAEMLALENDGHGDATDAFRDLQGHHQSKIWPITFPVAPTDLRESGMDELHEKGGLAKKSPYYPTLTLFTNTGGGLNYDLNDSFHIYLQRNPDLGREVMQSMLELSDVLEPLHPDIRTMSSEEREKHLPPSWVATKEAILALQNDASLKDIYENDQQYPNLNTLLKKLISKKGVEFDAEGKDSDTQIAEDKREWFESNKQMIDKPEGLRWLLERGLVDRLVAIYSDPQDEYRPLLPLTEKEGDMIGANKNIARGAMRDARATPLAGRGGAYGFAPLTGMALRGIAHMTSNERANKLLYSGERKPADMLRFLALGAMSRKDKLAGERESPREKILRQMGATEKEMDSIGRLQSDISYQRLFSQIFGDTRSNRHVNNNITLRPHDSTLRGIARMRHGTDVFRGSDGDGMVQYGKNHGNYNILTTNKKGVSTKKDTAMTDLARLQATLWGLAGAKPLTFEGRNIVTDLSALEGFVQALKMSNRRGIERRHVPEKLRFHPSPFFPNKDMSEFFDGVSPSLMPRTDDWRSAIQGKGEHETYLYPLEEEGGRYFLKLKPLSEGSHKAHLHSPDVSGALNAGAKKFREFDKPSITGEPRVKRRFNDYLLGLDEMGDNVRGAARTVAVAPDIGPGSDDPESPENLPRLEYEQEQRRRAYSDRIEVPREYIVDQGRKSYVVASHPAELLADWSDSIFHHLPRTNDVNEAMEMTHEEAESLASSDLGSTLAPTSEQRDYASESGLSVGAIASIARAEHDFVMGMNRGAILPALAYTAIHDAKRNPEQYKGLDTLSKKVSYFLEERLAIDGNVIPTSSDEEYSRRARLQKVMEVGHTYLNNSRSYDRQLLEREILQNASEEEKEQWEHSLDSINGLVSLSNANHRKPTSVSYDYSNPLIDLHTQSKQGEKDKFGFQILEHYLRNRRDPRVREILEGLGYEGRQGILALKRGLRDLKNLVDMPKRNITDNNTATKALKEIGHHAKNEEPLSWRPRINYDAELGGIGKKRKASDWELELRNRAKYAIMAKNMADTMSKITSQRELGESQNEYRFLFQRYNGKSIFDLIRDDVLAAKQENGKPALPEIANALQHSTGKSIEDLYKNFASFMWCKSRFKQPTPIPQYEYAVGPLAMGHPRKGRKNSYDDTVDLTPAKYSGIYNSDWFKARFGVHHNEADVRATEHTSKEPRTFLPMHPDIVNHIFSKLPRLHPDVGGDAPIYTNMSEGQTFGVPASLEDQRGDNMLTSLDVLTDTDLFFKSEKKDDGTPTPVKAMHRIFSLKDLDHLRGFSGDWVASAWPRGERLIIEKLKTKIKVHNSKNDDFTLPNSILEGIKEASDPKFMIDAIWDKDTLHIVDIIGSGDEKMENMPSKDRIRHLRAQFAASNGVMIPAPINTKRVDSEGLERAVKDLLAEKGVKQVLLRDADSTYMRGESRHPKWVLLTPEKSFDVMVLESRGNTHRIGIGPLFDEEGKALGNRATRCKGEYYMDVGSVHHSGLEVGQHITVKVPSVTSQNRKKMRVYNLNGARYLRDSEAKGTDSIETLDIACQTPNPNVPHKVRINKGVIHLEFPETHISFETERIGHSFLLKQADFGSDYDLKLAESQREYWSPLAAVLLRSEAEAEKMVEEKKPKKAHVVPEPPANHTKKPKKVLKPAENIMKDPEITKQVVAALEMIDNMLKEKVTFTGPKGLGIDFASPIESPSGPTTLTEPKNLPDHDPGHRESKGGECWCGAKRGQECEQGLATKMEDCPKFSPPHKEKDDNHIKIPVS